MNTNSQEALPIRVMTPDPVLRRPLVLIKSMLSDLMKSHDSPIDYLYAMYRHVSEIAYSATYGCFSHRLQPH